MSQVKASGFGVRVAQAGLVVMAVGLAGEAERRVSAAELAQRD